MKKGQTKDYAAYVAVRLFLCIVQALPMRMCERLARLLCWLAAGMLRIRRSVVDDNLRHVFPDWSPSKRDEVYRQMWHHLLLMVCELAHAPRKIHRTNWREYFRIEGTSTIVGYLLDARPVILVSGHFGNFEMAVYALGLLGFPTYAIARPLDNPYLHKFVTDFRSAKRQHMLSTQGTAEVIQKLLAEGQKLALLGDQHAGAKGCWVDFLGAPASCHKALAVFTLTAGAPMIVAYAKRVDQPLQFEVGVQGTVDPSDLPDALAGVKPLTQWYNRKLEELIRAEPGQYWWLHRRWKKRPPGRRRPRPAAA